jgi:hypothetical protein
MMVLDELHDDSDEAFIAINIIVERARGTPYRAIFA